jgi:hypothetical protein
MSVSDLQRTRFVHSPLMEAAESLWILSSGQVQSVHRGWYDDVVHRLSGVDRELLEAVVPGSKASIANFLLPTTGTDGPTTIETQLRDLAEMPAARLRRDLTRLWNGELPAAGQRLLADGRAGPRRAADALWQYWTVAIAPYWSGIRGVIDRDIAHRATTLTRQGVAAMFGDIHRRVRLHGETLHIDMTATTEQTFAGAGLKLVPSIFAWPYIVFDTKAANPSSLIYPTRGVGELWNAEPSGREGDALAALLGRNRAAVLSALVTAQPTSRLAQALGLSAPSVNQHLSVLRRAGLVTSWRSGRFVVYERTALGTSVVESSRGR